MIITGIAAVVPYAGKHLLGDEKGMPWRCSADLQFFKAMTMGKTCIVGHRTAQDLPTLVGRNLKIWTRDVRPVDLLCNLLSSLDEPEVMVIGGGATYRAFKSHMSSFVLSVLDPKYLVRSVGSQPVWLDEDLVNNEMTTKVVF